MEAPGGSYEFFDHAADVGVRCRAESMEGLFQTAALALMEWIGPRPPGEETVSLAVSLEAGDREEMLVRWLQELLYLFHQRHLYFLAASRLIVTETVLQGDLQFRHWDSPAYEEYQEVKAITYHQLRVCRDADAWHANVILDI